jgi:catechol 2,3-dioxygenase
VARNDPLRGHPASRLPTAGDVVGLVTDPAISVGADVGHVNLSVTNLERAVAFYRDAIGLRVTQRDARSAFLAAGDYHHHLALNTWDADIRVRPAHAAGLHHFALRLPDPPALAAVVVRILRAGHELLGATDHGVNLAVYLRDPDGNGLELMLDRPSGDWPRDAEGGIAMRVDPFDLRALVAEELRSR